MIKTYEKQLFFISFNKTMVTNKYNNITNANVNGEYFLTPIYIFFKKKIVVVQFFKTIRFELKYFFKKDSIEVP